MAVADSRERGGRGDRWDTGAPPLAPGDGLWPREDVSHCGPAGPLTLTLLLSPSQPGPFSPQVCFTMYAMKLASDLAVFTSEPCLSGGSNEVAV